MKKIETSALIGLGALGILFGRKMPGVKVIADAERVARYSAQPVVCNGKECHFDYVTPEQGQPVDLVLVAVKATVLEQAIKDIKKFVGPDTIIISVLNGITSENDIEAVYPGHCLWSVAIGMDATRVGRSLTFGAKHEAHRADQHRQGHDKVDRRKGRFAHKVGDAQAVHDAVDGGEQHGADAGQHEPQKAAVIKVVG